MDWNGPFIDNPFFKKDFLEKGKNVDFDTLSETAGVIAELYVDATSFLEDIEKFHYTPFEIARVEFQEQVRIAYQKLKNLTL
jgi:hypothetical protein